MAVESSQEMPVFGGYLDVHLRDTSHHKIESHQLGLNLDYDVDSLTSFGISGILGTNKNNTVTLDKTRYTLKPDSVIYLDSEIRSSNNWWNLNTTAFFNKQLNAKNKIQLNIDYLNFKNEVPTNVNSRFTNLGETTPHQAIFSTQQRGEANTSIRVFAGKTDFSSQVSQKFGFETGLKFTNTTSTSRSGLESVVDDQWIERPETQNHSKMDEQIRAGHLQFRWDVWTKTALSVGVRFESSHTQIRNVFTNKIEVDNVVNRLFPNVTLTQQLSNEQQLQVSYSDRINRPTYNDLASYVIYSDITAVYTGNPLLKPTLSQNLKLSYMYKSHQWNLVFSRDRNVIAQGQLTEAPLRNLLYMSPQNIKKMGIMGLQHNHTFSIAPWWSLGFFSQLNWHKMEIDYTLVPFTHSYFTLSSTLNNQVNLADRLALEISGWFNSTTFNGTVRLRHIGGMNLGLKKDFKNNNGTLQLTVSDILGTTAGILRYGTLTEEAFSIRNHVKYQLESTRSPIIRLTYSRSLGGNKTKTPRTDNEELKRIKI